MDLAGRTMPYSVEAEQSVLGGVLIDHNCMAAVSELIGEDDFYFEHNKAIFAVMLELFNTNKAIDIVTVSDALLGQSKLDAVGGISYLSNIASSVPTTANITQYANIVAQKALLRRLIDAGNSIVNMGYDASEEPETILEKSEKQIFDILQGKDSRSVVRINELLGETFKMMQDMAAKKGKVTGVPTGFGYLDQMTSGLQKSDLILIAARPAMGKTSFALNIAQNALKAMPSGGELTIEVTKDRNNVIIEIKDTGTGIEKEKISHIFEPFYSDGKTNRLHGTGLGLAIVKSLVNKAKGTISVSSEVGKGTSFLIKFPKNKRNNLQN